MADVPPREAAMGILGLKEEDLLKLEEEKILGIREYIRKKIASSSPSFGRFLSQAYLKYDELKKQGGPKVPLLIDLAKKAKNPETLTEEEIFSLVIELFQLVREKQGNSYGNKQNQSHKLRRS